ncbi:DUF86 domain-containing protein [Agromyces sp. SYSU K20354]|uniref:HepT-like ribonuclease domain-containing protein n=1 Tax=Agromyces cavernae TaxID=2898659 RepID=UPI001E4E1A54|nr:HepT-like ribonuclease domain-containing protein [Agromyces cavernae]MCD2441423.1 DUF86 domain-containing protein [Agromyces cavernae]
MTQPGPSRGDPARADAILADIRRFGATAARVVARGRTRFFEPDDDDQRRIARSVVVDLSTAADRLPAAFRNAHPFIDWAGIRATRNFIARDYTGTDDEVLWQAIAVQFPAILARLGIAAPGR